MTDRLNARHPNRVTWTSCSAGCTPEALTRARLLVGLALPSHAIVVQSVAAQNPAATQGRSWARWKNTGGHPLTLGLEEEVMLLDSSDLSLAHSSDDVIARLSDELVAHASQETNAAVIELATGIHDDVAGAVTESGRLRRQLAIELRSLGAVGACAGMHPLACTEETRISATPRYRLIADSMRFLARGEPTMALHVHVGVPDPEDAVRVMRRLRDNLPLLVALSANSPFSGGRDTGFASARTVVFDRFPRTGPPRAFGCYADYVETLDDLIASGALVNPTFLWWDVRLQPALGTVELRVMDAQSVVADTAPLVALVQSLARLELEDGPGAGAISQEVLAENRFLAARDGLDALLIDPARRGLVPVQVLLAELIEECRTHATALNCLPQFDRIWRLAAANGAVRQRTWVRAGHDLPSMLARLADRFAAQFSESALPPPERT
jgi:carboxylate-amine ligase